MRLRLFDRVRQLTRSRRRPAEMARGEPGQGRHRGNQRRFSWRSARPAPQSHPGPPTGGATWPGQDRRAPAELTPDRPAAPGAAPPPPRRAGTGPTGGKQTGGKQTGGNRLGSAGRLPSAGPPGSAAVGRGAGTRAARAGSARYQIREAPGAEALGQDELAQPMSAAPAGLADTGTGTGSAVGRELDSASAAEIARIATGMGRQTRSRRARSRAFAAAVRAHLPFVAPRTQGQYGRPDGRRFCGLLEDILWRQWDAESVPPAQVVEAVERLAELPEPIKQTLADGLDAIFIGPGGVPELDDMTALRGVPLPAGRATWDACAGAYGERKIVVGSQPSPTPDVMCHEVGHALDDLDSGPGSWQSDSAEFRFVYDQCQPHLASDFHRQPGGLGRKEFFADAFAAIASRQRPALVDMLSGDTRTALRVMLYFNRRYGI